MSGPICSRDAAALARRFRAASVMDPATLCFVGDVLVSGLTPAVAFGILSRRARCFLLPEPIDAVPVYARIFHMYDEWRTGNARSVVEGCPFQSFTGPGGQCAKAASRCWRERILLRGSALCANYTSRGQSSIMLNRNAKLVTTRDERQNVMTRPGSCRSCRASCATLQPECT